MIVPHINALDDRRESVTGDRGTKTGATVIPIQSIQALIHHETRNSGNNLAESILDNTIADTIRVPPTTDNKTTPCPANPC